MAHRWEKYLQNRLTALNAASTGYPAKTFFPTEKIVSTDGTNEGSCNANPLTVSPPDAARFPKENFSRGDVPLPMPRAPNENFWL